MVNLPTPNKTAAPKSLDPSLHTLRYIALVPSGEPNCRTRRGRDRTELFYFFRTGLVHVEIRAAELMRQSRDYISVLDRSLSQASNALRSMRIWFGRYPGMLE